MRRRVRQNRSRALIALLEKVFKRLIATQSRPKSGLGQALQYALGQWPAMQTYLEDGRVEIDNNATENDIRPSAVGKKNWLFIGSPDAGKRTAVMYTLLMSARNHGVDPQAYLRAVIESIRMADARVLTPEMNNPLFFITFMMTASIDLFRKPPHFCSVGDTAIII